jgi:two-component system KDP operon response regulator KdpE
VTRPADAPARLLLVEDQAINRALVMAVLARADDPRIRDATILEAASLGEARQFIANDGVEIVLLDVRLPDGDGLDLAREIASRGSSDASWARPRMIVLSASVMPAQREEAIDAGCDAFLAKPFDTRELLRLIGSLLDLE